MDANRRVCKAKEKQYFSIEEELREKGWQAQAKAGDEEEKKSVEEEVKEEEEKKEEERSSKEYSVFFEKIRGTYEVKEEKGKNHW